MPFSPFSRAPRGGHGGQAPPSADEVEDAIEGLLSLHTTRSMSMSVTRQGAGRGAALGGGARLGPTSPVFPTASPSRSPHASGTGMAAAAPGASARGFGPNSGAQKGLGPGCGAGGGSSQHDALEVSRRALSLTPFRGGRRASALALELASSSGAGAGVGGGYGYGIGSGSPAASPHMGAGSPLFAQPTHALFRRGGGGGAGGGAGGGGGGGSGPSTGLGASRGGDMHSFYSYGQVPDAAVSPLSPLSPSRASAAASARHSTSSARRAQAASAASAAAGNSHGWNIPRYASGGGGGGGGGGGAGGRELAVTPAGASAAEATGRDGRSAGAAAAASSAGGLSGMALQSPSSTASGGGARLAAGVAAGGGVHVSNAGSGSAADSPGVSTGSIMGQHRQQLLLSNMSSATDSVGPSSLGGPHARKASMRARGSVPGSFGLSPLAMAGGSVDSALYGAAAAVAMMLVPPQTEQGLAHPAEQQHQPPQQQQAHARGSAGGSTDMFTQPSLNILVAQQLQSKQEDQHFGCAGAAAVASGAQAPPGFQSSTMTSGGATRPSGGSGGGAGAGAGNALNSFNFYHGSSTPLMSPAPTSYAHSHLSRVSQVSVGTSAYTSTGLPHHLANAAAAPPAAIPASAAAAAAAAASAAGGMLQVQASGASATAARTTAGSAGAPAAAAGAGGAAAAPPAAASQQPPASPTTGQPGVVQQAYVTRGPYCGGSVHGGSVFYGGGGARGGAGGATGSARNSSSVHGGGAYLMTTAGSNIVSTGAGLFYAGSSMPGNLYTTSAAAAGSAYVTHAVRTSVQNCRAPSIGGNSTSSAAPTAAYTAAGAASLGGLDGLMHPRQPGASTLGRTTTTTGGRAAALRAGIITCTPALLEEGGDGGGADGGGAGAGGAFGRRSEAAVSLSSATTKSNQFRPMRMAGPAMKAFHLAWAALFLTFVSSFAPAALSPIIASDLHLSKAVLAVAGAMSLLSSFITRVLMGGWVRRYGPRYCQALTLLLTAPALACTALVRNGAGFVAARAAIGTGLATFVSSNFWIVLMFDSSVLGAAAATCASWGNAGSGVSLILMPLIYQAMLKVYGGDVRPAWSAVFYFPAGAHLVLGMLTLLFGQDTGVGDFLDFDAGADDMPGGAMLAVAGGGSYHDPKALKSPEPEAPIATATSSPQKQERRKQQQQPQSPQLLLPTRQFTDPLQAEPVPSPAQRAAAAWPYPAGQPQPHQYVAAQATITGGGGGGAAAAAAAGGAGGAGAAGHGVQRGSSSSGATDRGSGGAPLTAMAAAAAAAAAAGVSGAQPIPGGGHGRGRESQAGEDPSMHDLPQRLPSASLRGWRAASARQISLRRLDTGGAAGGGGLGAGSFMQMGRGPLRVSPRELPPPAAAGDPSQAAAVYDGDDDDMLDDGDPIFLLARMDTGGMPERIEEHSETLACASGSADVTAAGSSEQQAAAGGGRAQPTWGTEGRRVAGSAAGPVAEGLEEPAAAAGAEEPAPEPTLEVDLLPAGDAAAATEDTADAGASTYKAGDTASLEAGTVPDQATMTAVAQQESPAGATDAPAPPPQQDRSARFPPPYLHVPPSPTAERIAASAAGRLDSPFCTAAAHDGPGSVASSVPPAAPFRTAVTIPVQKRTSAAVGSARPVAEVDFRRRRSASQSGAGAPYPASPPPAAAAAAAAPRGALGLPAGATSGGALTPTLGGSLPAGSPTPSAVAVTAEGVPPAPAGASGAHAAYLNVVRGRLSQGGAIKAAAAAAAATAGNAGGRGQQQGLAAAPAGGAGAPPVTYTIAGGGTDDPSHHPRWSNNNNNNNAPVGVPSAADPQLASAPAGGGGGIAAREGTASLLPTPRAPKHHHALGLGWHEAFQLYGMACRNYRCLLLALNYGYNFGAQLALYNILSIYLYERYGMSLLGAGALAAMPGLLNVFSRVSGSLLSGLVCRHFGMRGRLWLLWSTQTGGGLCCVGLGLCGGGQGGLGATGVLLLLFGLCTQIAAGVTFTVAPYASFRAFAAVLGVTSAGGQLGGVVLLLAFFVTPSLSYQQGIMWMGVAIIVVSLSVAAIRFPMWGGMLAGPDTRYGGVQEEQYYLSEWTAEEQASGAALPALMFAMHARSERSGWDHPEEKRSLARV